MKIGGAMVKLAWVLVLAGACDAALDGGIGVWKERAVRDVRGGLEEWGGQVSEEYFGQFLDHFDNNNGDTYKQRWFVNQEFWKRRADDPVFILIGGEGAESLRSVQDGHAVELAKQHNALVLCLEHRFYGKSVPTKDLSTSNLGLLNSQQALADLANFIGFAKRRFALSERNKIITFGGSYPGALSAWARLRLPHFVYGAVASSAPVRAQEDFAGYFAIVTASLAEPLVGGSKPCVGSIRSAFDAIGQRIKTKEGREQLAERFHSCGSLEDPKDRGQFISNLAEAFQVLVQYNGQQGPRDINATCAFLLQPGDPFDLVALLFEQWLPQSKHECVDFSYEHALQSLQDVVPDPNKLSRQWVFQTCSQFGYFQTCEQDCIFSPMIDLNVYVDLCEQLFNISQPRIKRLVEFSNLWYGGDKPGASRVLYVNGLIDPWHFLSVLTSRGDDQSTVVIPGASHCQDMGPALDTDNAHLKRGKQRIAEKVAQWLESKPPSSSMDLSST